MEGELQNFSESIAITLQFLLVPSANREKATLGVLQTKIYSSRNVLRLWQHRSHNNRVSKFRALKSSLCRNTNAHICSTSTSNTQFCLWADVKGSYQVAFVRTAVYNQCRAATTAQCIITSGTKWLPFFGGAAERLRAAAC